MKKLIYCFFVLLFVTFYSCDSNDDKFSGSPVDNLTIETITGTVSTDVENNFALPGQSINFTVNLPASFRSVVTDSVTVEATTITRTGSKRVASVIIPENQLSGTGTIIVGGSSVFDSEFDLYLSAINVKNNNSGKHYLINSNKVTINSGNSSIPSFKDNRLQIVVSWDNKSTGNNVRCYIKNASNTTFTFQNGSSFREFKSYPVYNSQLTSASTGNPLPESNAYAFNPSDYTLSIAATAATDLESSPIDLKYRVVFRLPTGAVKIINGVYNGMTTTSGRLDIAKFTKTGIDDTSDYVNFINLNP